MHTTLRLVVLLAVVACTPRLIFAQGGSLTPPGGPAQMMKTLSQIEPRTDIAELAGDATAVKIIPGPGHYYLTGDLAGAAGKDSIRIATAGRVTIDLNGFSLTSVGTGRSGILVPAANDMVVIRNGAILASGGATTFAVSGNGTHVVCEDLKVFSAGAQTLTLGADAVVSRCRIQGGGISTQARSVVRDTVIEGGTSDLMIITLEDSRLSKVTFTTGTGTVSTGERCELSDCIINTGGPVIFFAGGAVIQTGAGCVLRNCMINAGTTNGSAILVGHASLITGCRVTSVFRDGIIALSSNNVTVESCAFQNFGRVGIKLGSNARVRDCTIVGGAGGSTNGMELGDKAVVSGCSVADCGSVGIQAAGAANISGCIVSESGLDGITAGAASTLSNCTVRANGASGITAGTGSALSECQSSGNTTDGIVTGTGATLSKCTATSNLGRGILAGEGSTLSDSSATTNQGGAGISCGNGCSLTNCVARANTSTASSSFGILVSGESTLIGCTVTNTNSTAATLTATTGVGISVGAASTVKDCTVQGNRGDGIRATSLCQIVGNTCDGNGFSTGDGAGIHTISLRNRIERNTATGSDRGIEVTSTGSLIIGNTAGTNTSNYLIAASNRYGAIIDLTATGTAAVSTNSAAGTISAADSTANIAH